MEDFERQEAAALLITRAKEADCRNEKIRDVIENVALRKGGALAQWPNEPDETRQNRELLPTSELYDALRRRRNLNLINCTCKLCSPFGFREVDKADDNTLRSLVTLVLCGCLFAFGEAISNRQSGDLINFIADNAYDGDLHYKLFGKDALPSAECKHGRFGQDIKDLTHTCVDCRWKAFEAAVGLKKRIVDVSSVYTWDFIPDLTFKNIPFIKEAHIETQDSSGSTRLYACKVHRQYASSSLVDMELFRKVYVYQPREVLLIDRAKREAEIARKISKRRENFAQLLFAFTYKAQDYVYVELVYPRYDYDLGNLLSGQRILKPNDSTETDKSVDKRDELVDDELWALIMSIMRAVGELHDEIKNKRIPCFAHMDIKPQNILVRVRGDSRSFFLTDFGHAAERTMRDATPDYAPPPEGDGESRVPPRDATTRERKSPTAYDVWSMGCLLLQILVFINGGSKRIEEFNSSRKAGYQTAAFWELNPNQSTPTLRKTVVDTINELQKLHGPKTKKALDQIRKMLRVNPEERPDIESCNRTFARLEEPGSKERMKCDSEGWKILYRPSDEERTTPVELSIYRDSQNQLSRIEATSQEVETIRLTMRFSEWEDGPSFSSTTARDAAWFIPQAFWDKIGPTDHPWACQLKGLHEDGVFYFNSKTEYLKFMGLMTYQQVIPKPVRDLPITALNIVIKSCRKGPIMRSMVDAQKLQKIQELKDQHRQATKW
ncbi:protein kinase domain-containing protein [Colletotrichum camelliae]|nr:protein kinase domain-containing protein [Colletotrichum camelliae]